MSRPFSVKMAAFAAYLAGIDSMVPFRSGESHPAYRPKRTKKKGWSPSKKGRK